MEKCDGGEEGGMGSKEVRSWASGEVEKSECWEVRRRGGATVFGTLGGLAIQNFGHKRQTMKRDTSKFTKNHGSAKQCSANLRTLEDI